MKVWATGPDLDISIAVLMPCCFDRTGSACTAAAL